MIADLVGVMQREAIDGNLPHLRIWQHDPGRGVERDREVDGKLACLVDAPAAFVQSGGRVVARPGPLERPVGLGCDPGGTEAGHGIAA